MNRLHYYSMNPLYGFLATQHHPGDYVFFKQPVPDHYQALIGSAPSRLVHSPGDIPAGDIDLHIDRVMPDTFKFFMALQHRGCRVFYNGTPLTSTRLKEMYRQSVSLSDKTAFHQTVRTIAPGMELDRDRPEFPHYAAMHEALADRMDTLPYPIVLKSSVGMGGRSAMIIHHAAQLETALQEIFPHHEFTGHREYDQNVLLSPFIIERYYEQARDYTAILDLRHPERFTVNKQLVDELSSRGNETADDLTAAERAQIEGFVKRYVAYLDEHGLNYGGYMSLDFIITADGQVKAVEVDTRMSSSSHIAQASDRPFTSRQYTFHGPVAALPAALRSHLQGHERQPGSPTGVEFWGIIPDGDRTHILTYAFGDTVAEAHQRLDAAFGHSAQFSPRQETAHPGYSRSMSYYVDRVPQLQVHTASQSLAPGNAVAQTGRFQS